MHGHMVHWVNSRSGACGSAEGDSPRRAAWEARRHAAGDEAAGPFGAGAFGVRRPLRFLAWKLQLDEPQVAALAAVLDDLKTERAQAAVDERRTLSAFADAMAGEKFDAAKAEEAATFRATSAGRLQQVVATSLGRIHALLQPEQRTRFATLIRTGALVL
jgi:Spy/CpxP family protein refolding chaperone